MERIAHHLGLVLLALFLVSGHATALVTDFDSTAGYHRSGSYGKLYARLLEQDRTVPANDSTLSPIGRNRPGKTRRPSVRRSSAPAPSLTTPVR